MKLQKLITILLFITLLIQIQTITAQSEMVKSYNKNVIHGSLGLFLTANTFYDRILSNYNSETKFAVFSRVGYSLYAIPSMNGSSIGNMLSLQGGFFTGKKFSHFETTLGMLYQNSFDDDYSAFRPALSIGYRGHKPGGKFMFRIGVGFPELMYTGVGYSF